MNEPIDEPMSEPIHEPIHQPLDGPASSRAQEPATAGPDLRRFDVCNGDADGLCATIQYRLHDPSPATLVTGLKREIALLQRVPLDAADEVRVFDVSMERNREAMLRLLERGARVRYFDHHSVREIPRHPRLDAHIDLSGDVCTSLIVDRHLGGRFRRWALVGAYGDNLVAVADRLAASIALPPAQRDRLRALGVAINYNAYGEDEGDVLIAPARLFERLARYPDPLDFVERETICAEIEAMRRDDLARAVGQPPHREDAGGEVRVLPDAPWSRRISGSLANDLAQANPGRAHAVLRQRSDGTFAASIRAPLTAPGGADSLCRKFGGAGRAIAGGIDRLPAHEIDRFIREFSATRWG